MQLSASVTERAATRCVPDDIATRHGVLPGTVHTRSPHSHAPLACRPLAALPPRYEKRHSNFSAHLSPAFRCREGDTVVVGQCR